MYPGLSKINHIVVLMLENRSFDNMAGWLYDPGNPPPYDKVPGNQQFEGLAGKMFSNPIPPEAHGSERKRVPAGKGKVMTGPNPGPGEGFLHTNTELYGDAVLRSKGGPFGKKLNNLPCALPVPAPMNGFVRDYIETLNSLKHSAEYEDYRIIMDCYTPEQVPVISTLAYNYAVCDQWFCSVPSQTWCNRSFLNAATSSGFVDNAPYRKWLRNNSDTVFNRIQDEKSANLTWKVYFDRWNILPLAWVMHTRLRPYLFSNFAGMKAFKKDASEGNLPSYSLIEPRFFFVHNDEHPPDAGEIITSSVLAGEQLIYNVYQAIRNSRNWDSTLLVITFDEHGGCCDHVPPPPAVPPEKGAPAGEYGFRFDRLGVRVCTVLVSPYIEPGTVFRARDRNGCEVPLDHTSVIKTITDRWSLDGLTERDKAAFNIGGALTLSKPRKDFPNIVPRPYSPLSGLKEEFKVMFRDQLKAKPAGNYPELKKFFGKWEG